MSNASRKAGEDEVAVFAALRGCVDAADGKATGNGRDVMKAIEAAGESPAVLDTFPFGGMIASASMLFTTVDDPLAPAPPAAPYAASCDGGDGFLIERDGKLFVL